MKKILIFPSGLCLKNGDELSSYGRGHAARCISLARHIQDLKQTTEIVFAASGIEYDLCQNSGFEVVELPIVALNSTTQKEIKKTEFEINLMHFHEPDLVISDTHKEATIAANFNGIPNVAICDLPPIGFFPIFALLSDLILIPHIKQIIEIPEYLNQCIEKVEIIGPIFSREIKKQQDFNEFKKEQMTNTSKLIVAYTSRLSIDREVYLKNLIDSFILYSKESPSARYILIGPGMKITPETRNELNLMIYEYVPNLLKYIKESDVFITRSCITAMESIILGTPTIMIPITGDKNQQTIAKRLNELEALFHLQITILTPKILKEKIGLILTNHDLRRKTITQGKNLIDDSGGRKAAELIVKMLEK